MASPFASHTTDTIPVLGDPPHTITIQKLSGRDLERAQFEHMSGVLTGRGRNWATTFTALARAGIATEADAHKVLVDPLSGYDRLTLAKAGVKGWSYEEKGQPKPVTPAAIDDFDDERLEFVATAVLKLTKPALFLTAEEREDAQKNG